VTCTLFDPEMIALIIGQKSSKDASDFPYRYKLPAGPQSTESK